MKLAASEIKKIAARGSSSGSPTRCCGTRSRIAARVGSPRPAIIGVSVRPGAGELTRMPFGASARERERVSERIAPFEAT
jgi:hypothetical protein